MPVTTLPLAFSPNQRGPIITSTSAPTKDARMVRCFITTAPNPITGTKEAFVEKIPGWPVDSTPGGANTAGDAIIAGACPFGTIVTAFNAANSPTIYSGTTSQGTSIQGVVSKFIPAMFSGVNSLIFKSQDRFNWFLMEDALSGFTFTADTTSGNANLTNVSSLTGLYVGQALSGTGIAATARISSITPPTTVTMSANATANGSGVTITREGIAKVIDADALAYPFGDPAELDGYYFVYGNTSTSTDAPVIAHSALNDPSSWNSSNRITPNVLTEPRGLVVYRDMVVALGELAIQFFRNTGNASGSILSQVDELTIQGLGAFSTASGDHQQSAVIKSSLYFIGEVGGVIDGVYRLNGFSPEKISNDTVTRSIISGVRGIQGQGVMAFDELPLFGMTFLYIACQDTNIQWLYCIDNGQWYEPGFFTGGMRVCTSTTEGGALGTMLEASDSDGRVFGLQHANLTYQDASAAYTMTIQTPELVLNDGEPFSVHEVEIIGDTQSSGLSTLSSCDDDYTTFTVRGAFDMTRQRKVVNRCGHYKNHVIFKIEHSANTAFRAQALKIHWSPAVGRGFR